MSRGRAHYGPEPIHRAGPDGYCITCIEIMPCRALLAAGPLGTISHSSCCTIFGLALQAYDRTLGAASDREWGPLDAIVAIVLAAAAAEAFINEFAELVRQSTESRAWSEWPGTAPALASLATQVLAAETERPSTVGKFSIALQSLTGRPPDQGARLFDDFKLLFRARDGLMHRRLEVQPATPGAAHSSLFDVVQAMQSRHVTAIEPVVPEGALDQLSTRGVARWACNAAAAMVKAVLASVPEEERPRLASELSQFGRYFVTID